MATRKGPRYLTTPKLRGGVYVYTRRGRLTVAKWPRKRGRPKSPQTAWMNAWFKDATRKLRYVDAAAMDKAIKLTKGTGLYPRDVLMKASTGGLFDITTADGQNSIAKKRGFYPVAFQGLLLPKTATQNIPAGVSTAISWGVPLLDTSGLFNAAAPTLITIPVGINIVRFELSLSTTTAAALTTACGLVKNGVVGYLDYRMGSVERGSCNMDTGPLQVAAGDVYSFYVQYASARTIAATQNSRGLVEILDCDFPPVPS